MSPTEADHKKQPTTGERTPEDVMNEVDRRPKTPSEKNVQENQADAPTD